MERRIFGEESEYGAIIRRADGQWEETYPRGASNLSFHFSPPPNLVTLYFYKIFSGHPREIFLPNGARIYAEGSSHIECATPEASLVGDLILASKGCELIMENLMKNLPDGNRVFFIKDNTDAVDSVTFGAHENYLFSDPNQLIMSKQPHFHFSANFLVILGLFMVTRIIFAGNGVISNSSLRGNYFLSHRSRFIGNISGPGNMGVRKCLATEKFDARSSALPHHYRLHLTGGDPNISEFSLLLKFGTTGLVLRLIEDNLLGDFSRGLVSFGEGYFSAERDLLNALFRINEDLTFSQPVIDFEGRRLTAIEIQEIFLARARENYPRPSDPPDVKAETETILREWQRVLDGLKKNSPELSRKLDWAIKLRLIKHFLRKEELTLEEFQRRTREGEPLAVSLLERLKHLELRYHELSERSYWRKLRRSGGIDSLFSEDDFEKASRFPPGFDNPSSRTRSWARVRLINWAKAHNRQYAAHWDRFFLNAKEGNVIEKEIQFNNPFLWESPEIQSILDWD